MWEYRESLKNKKLKNIDKPLYYCYAHIEVLVTFLLVNFFSFLVITRPR